MNVHYEFVRRRFHSSGGFSAACVYKILSVLALVIIPFLVAFGSHNFWLKRSTYFEQPLVQFKHKVAVVLEGFSSADGGATRRPLSLFWSSVPLMNDVFEANLRSPILRSWADDHNRDGTPDALHVFLRFPLNAGEDVHQVTSVATFDYQLRDRVKLQMEAMAVVQHGSPVPGAALAADGTLQLQQRIPFSVRAGFQELYRGEDLLPASSSPPASARDVVIPAIVQRYEQRNFTARFDVPYPLWSGSSGLPAAGVAQRAFALNMTFRVPSEQDIRYTPDTSELLKFAWIQPVAEKKNNLFCFFALLFEPSRKRILICCSCDSIFKQQHRYLAIFFVFYYLLQILDRHVFENQVVETRVDTEGVYAGPKLHRF